MFPRGRVAIATANVERPIAAHSTGPMPVWGHIYRAVGPSDSWARQRVDNVVAFVETQQQPFSPSVVTGRALFAAYCANCHGADGRGGDVPDLTTFAMRNADVFPAARLAQIIDGRGGTHGPRDMPVCGTVFQAVPGQSGASAAAARIAALTEFLESIQLRATH